MTNTIDLTEFDKELIAALQLIKDCKAIAQLRDVNNKLTEFKRKWIAKGVPISCFSPMNLEYSELNRRIFFEPFVGYDLSA